MNAASPRWLPDPTGRHEHRYWDGDAWTDDVSDAGTTAKDPMTGADPSAAPTAATDEAGDASDPPAPPGLKSPGPRRRGQGKPGGPGRSTGLLVGLGVVFGALIAGLVFVVLSQDDDGGRDPGTNDAVSTIAGAIRSNSNNVISDAEADCVVEAMANELGTDRLNQVAEETLTNPDPFTILEDDELSAVFRSMLECVPPDRLADIMANAGAGAG